MALNVLIVDDSAVMRSMIARTLSLSGVELGEIHQATNGQEGLEALRAHWVDLVLVDVNMPVMNGQEMIEHVRADDVWKDLPIIVVSTEGSETRIAALRNLGAAFIHKPFAPETVRDVIKELTGAHHAA